MKLFKNENIFKNGELIFNLKVVNDKKETYYMMLMHITKFENQIIEMNYIKAN